MSRQFSKEYELQRSNFPSRWLVDYSARSQAFSGHTVLCQCKRFCTIIENSMLLFNRHVINSYRRLYCFFEKALRLNSIFVILYMQYAQGGT